MNCRSNGRLDDFLYLLWDAASNIPDEPAGDLASLIDCFALTTFPIWGAARRNQLSKHQPPNPSCHGDAPKIPRSAFDHRYAALRFSKYWLHHGASRRRSSSSPFEAVEDHLISHRRRYVRPAEAHRIIRDDGLLLWKHVAETRRRREYMELMVSDSQAKLPQWFRPLLWSKARGGRTNGSASGLCHKDKSQSEQTHTLLTFLCGRLKIDIQQPAIMAKSSRA